MYRILPDAPVLPNERPHAGQAAFPLPARIVCELGHTSTIRQKQTFSNNLHLIFNMPHGVARALTQLDWISFQFFWREPHRVA